jgi:hypothetical protein
VVYSIEVQESAEETKNSANFIKKGAKKNEKRKRVEETEEEQEEVQTVGTSKPSKFCKICKREGHWTSNCRNLKELVENREAILAAGAAAKQNTNAYNTRSTKKGNTKDSFVTYKVNLAPYRSMNLRGFLIILDTAANIALVNDLRLLTKVHKSKNIVSVKAVNGQTLETNICGTLNPFGIIAFYCPEAEVNLIPLSPLEETFQVIYTQRVNFEIIVPDYQKVLFQRTAVDEEGNSFYVFDATPIVEKRKEVNVATVEENTMSYSKREVDDAKKAREFIRKMGYPSTRQAIDLVQSGAVLNCPITAHDILRAEKIFGPDIASLKGKTVLTKNVPIKKEYISKPVSEIQSLHADLLFVDNNPYLITVSTPLNLILVSDLGGNKTKEVLSDYIVRHVNEYKSEGFSVDMILCDREGGIIASKELLKGNGVVLNLSSAGQHVPVIERNIRTVKERIRAILSTMPFRVPSIFMSYLVDFAVMKINSMPKSTMIGRQVPVNYLPEGK